MLKQQQQNTINILEFHQKQIGAIKLWSKGNNFSNLRVLPYFKLTNIIFLLFNFVILLKKIVKIDGLIITWEMVRFPSYLFVLSFKKIRYLLLVDNWNFVEW